MISLIKKLAGAQDSVAALSGTLSGLNTELAQVERSLADAQAGYGERIANASSAVELDKADTDLASRRRDVDRCRAARDAVERRLQQARAAEAERDLAQQWDACEKALCARRKALDALTKAIEAAGQAKIAAEDAAREAFRLLPIKRVASASATPQTFTAEFCGLDDIAHRLLTAAVARSDAPTDSSVWDIRQHPSLTEQHDKAAAHWLSYRTAVAQPPLPDAA